VSGSVLPSELQSGIAGLIEGVPAKELARRSLQLSLDYRGGKNSERAVRDNLDVAAYATARLPATYAAIAAVLGELKTRAPNFAPESLLDMGAGPGTASWAVADAWPQLNSVAMLDCSSPFLAVAEKLARASLSPALRNATLTLGDLASTPLNARYELVVAAYALAEMSGNVADRAIQLWNACGGALVIVEPGTPAGFDHILSARAALLASDARIVAPCPSAYPCPIKAPDWCHFAQRLPRSRAHMRAKHAVVPFEDEKFSYLVVARDEIVLAPTTARIVAPPRATKPSLQLRLCTQGGIVERAVLKRDKAAFKAVAKKRWGDAL